MSEPYVGVGIPVLLPALSSTIVAEEYLTFHFSVIFAAGPSRAGGEAGRVVTRLFFMSQCHLRGFCWLWWTKSECVMSKVWIHASVETWRNAWRLSPDRHCASTFSICLMGRHSFNSSRTRESMFQESGRTGGRTFELW